MAALASLVVLATWMTACAGGRESHAGAVDPACCTVLFAPSSAIPADGARTATVRVVLRDSRRRPVARRRVQVTATGSDNNVQQPELLTDEEGVVTAQISSTRAELKTVLVVLDPGQRSVLLPQAPTIDFVETIQLDGSGETSHE